MPLISSYRFLFKASWSREGCCTFNGKKTNKHIIFLELGVPRQPFGPTLTVHKRTIRSRSRWTQIWWCSAVVFECVSIFSGNFCCERTAAFTVWRPTPPSSSWWQCFWDLYFDTSHMDVDGPELFQPQSAAMLHMKEDEMETSSGHNHELHATFFSFFFYWVMTYNHYTVKDVKVLWWHLTETVRTVEFWTVETKFVYMS